MRTGVKGRLCLVVVLDCRPSPSAGRCRQQEQRMQTEGVREASERRWHASCSCTDGQGFGRQRRSAGCSVERRKHCRGRQGGCGRLGALRSTLWQAFCRGQGPGCQHSCSSSMKDLVPNECRLSRKLLSKNERYLCYWLSNYGIWEVVSRDSL